MQLLGFAVGYIDICLENGEEYAMANVINQNMSESPENVRNLDLC